MKLLYRIRTKPAAVLSELTGFVCYSIISIRGIISVRGIIGIRGIDMYSIKNLTDNNNVNIENQTGAFTVIAHKRDMSVSPESAITSYFSSKMNILRRQLVVDLNNTDGVILQKGVMQWMAGDVKQTSGIKGVGDLFGKAIASKVTKESAIKPEYIGTGIVVTEPTYKFLLVVDVANEFGGNMVMDDGMFLCAENSLKLGVSVRKTLSSGIAGGEGLFNLSLSGRGLAVLESKIPREEIVVVSLSDDVIRIDGNLAIAWTDSLSFTVERSGKSLIGSVASGEGLVNVYRGTGTVWMAPL